LGCYKLDKKWYIEEGYGRVVCVVLSRELEGIEKCQVKWREVQLVAKKNGKCKFGFVHLSINCQLDNTCQIIFKNINEF
jgi:hypothetical protein